ncbi:uncharacterized protein LOC126215347 isoform X2 [Schistocerca nitens]|uniref:uncharacterized protein LOC126215347 isoform X2 n=1 Tax=Schistocerca nitens TaxID=7011 RepID=UPI00211998ED|nr:uncharacterized protein LOC126215347 isoform X2 [Schistocerca nitens]
MYQMRAERQTDGSTKCLGGELKYGDRCDDSSQCGFDHGICEKQSGKQLCLCQPDYPVTNHINMCGKPAKINETCEFSEQCERTTEKTECRDGRCVCLFQMGALYKNDGSVECVDIKQEPPSLQYVDPTMIGVLVGLGLMFIILCVVLHLFSKARWRENRTIFNTPNPRLMNVSLLRDSKLIHGGGGSRRGSKGSNVSATSTRSPRSPAKPPPSPLVSSAHPHSLAAVAATPATTGSAPTLESVTVEIRGSRATTPQQQQL